MSNLFVINTDGASRKNPGPSGAGVSITKNGKLFFQQGFYVGIKTNNQAEYLAVIIGLFLTESWVSPSDSIVLVSDSELLIKQLLGIYRVKNEGLRPLFNVASALVRKHNVKVKHVMREQNVRADLMANEGIDQKIDVPVDCHAWLKTSGVTL